MKTNAECAEILLKFVRQNVNECSDKLLKANCDIRGIEVAHEMWKEANSEDGLGAFNSNPYNVSEWDKANVIKLKTAKETWEDVFNFTMKRVCQNIKNEE